MLQELREHIGYNYWANSCLVDACQNAETGQISKKVVSSFPSILDTWAHIIWAEKLWLDRWREEPLSTGAKQDNYTDLETIGQAFAELYTKQVAFLQQLSPGDENKNISYSNFEGQTWKYSLHQMVQHVIIHSAYHRGQLVTLFRQAGLNPRGTDYLLYFDEIKKK